MIKYKSNGNVKNRIIIAVILLSVFPFVQSLFSHCEIPCGIYNDKMRCEMIEEHIKTIEKSINMINDLSKERNINYNQLVRWVNYKEQHADEIQVIVSQYFMTQRVKPVEVQEADKYKEYINKLNILHEMLISAMKTKQTTDLEHVNDLRSLLKSFRTSYFGPQEKENEHNHEH